MLKAQRDGTPSSTDEFIKLSVDLMELLLRSDGHNDDEVIKLSFYLLNQVMSFLEDLPTRFSNLHIEYVQKLKIFLTNAAKNPQLTLKASQLYVEYIQLFYKGETLVTSIISVLMDEDAKEVRRLLLQRLLNDRYFTAKVIADDSNDLSLFKFLTAYINQKVS